MALKGVKVVEMAGLAPAPMCGMILADFGASVTRVDKVNSNVDLDCLSNGKKMFALNLKKKEGIIILKKLINKSDVLIEPYRKGVMESLGLSPSELFKSNPALIYARLTGFGQSGVYSQMAGHDINYVATSGVLSLLGRADEKPTAPINLLADFGGGGLMCALGITLALLERNKSGKGQIIDASMVDGTAYLSSWIFRSQNLPIWGRKKGENILDSGSHFYDTYETKDGKYVAVGALEVQFFNILVEKLNLKEIDHFGNYKENKEIFESIFKTKTQEEWCAIFDGSDACVTPVLTPIQAAQHPHNLERKTFTIAEDGRVIPNPSPKLSRTPAHSSASQRSYPSGYHTRGILEELGYEQANIERFEKDEVVKVTHEKSKI